MKFAFIFATTTTIISSLMCMNSSAGLSKSSANEVDETDFFSFFMSEAHMHDAVFVKNFTKDIPWLNMNLMQQSADFYRRNYPGVTLGHLISFNEVIALKATTSTVMCTQTFENTTKAYERFLKTVFYIRLISDSGPEILNPESVGYKTIKLVRQRHRSASYISQNRSLPSIDSLNYKSIVESKEKDIVNDHDIRTLVLALRADLAHVDTSEAPEYLNHWDWSSAINQFDLGVGQFLFYCHTVMHPSAFGIYQANEGDIRAHAHFWAVVGRLLGLEDRFNVALNLPFEQYTRFYRNTIVASLKHIDDRAIRVMTNMMEGLTKFNPVPIFSSLKCYLFYTLRNNVEEFEGRSMWRIMNIGDKICVQLIGVYAGPINLSNTVTMLYKLAFQTFLQHEYRRLGIKYEW